MGWPPPPLNYAPWKGKGVDPIESEQEEYERLARESPPGAWIALWAITYLGLALGTLCCGLPMLTYHILWSYYAQG